MTTKTRTTNSLLWCFNNTYNTLPDKFYTKINPSQAPLPELVLFNKVFAEELGILLPNSSSDAIAEQLSGNAIPEGVEPLAQAYAGHQFGHFTMLGDGRAVLLGEHITPSGLRYDIQLKGSGRTPYSRRGDGKATLKAMLREYLISEAMHHLGIPSSRSLAVVITGEQVHREEAFRGAVLTRIAASHIRVGTFEYAASFLNKEELKKLTVYTIQRHYPEILKAENNALALLNAVMEKQIDLIVNWMRIGFIHGVMNTDNMSIAGETIDYGPCAFINEYSPDKVFSSIDTHGRYSFGNQPGIAKWNLSCFAATLLPLIDTDIEKAKKMAGDALQTFNKLFQDKWWEMMGNKIGIQNVTEKDFPLIHDLLEWMETNKADYTNTFLQLFNDATPKPTEPIYKQWHTAWQKHISGNQGGLEQAKKLMQKTNPTYIPRNHKVEEALDAASLKNDFNLFNKLLAVLSNPYEYKNEFAQYTLPPDRGDEDYQTFCGT